MNQEDIQKALEAIGKGGITVAGDLVLEKNVEYEVNNVENGGIGIQVVNGRVDMECGSTAKKELSNDKLARAIENCQQYFWGNSAYAVVFCVCRDVYGMEANKSAFERMVELLPYTKDLKYSCPSGTLANAFSDNPFYNDKIDKWESMNAKGRAIILRDELKKQLEL